MKKRILSILLAFALAFSLVSPALAEDGSTPAFSTRFFSVVGQGGYLDIVTAITVHDNYYGHTTEYPSLYILKDGVLTLLRTFKVGDCNCGEMRYKDSNGNYLPYQAYIQLLYTDAECTAFDFTADYVLKIPAGIYKDASGNPIGQQSVSFSSSVIKNDRNELTLFGKYFDKFDNSLHSLCKGTFLANLIYVPFLNVTNYIFGILNIKLIKPVTAA